MTNSFMKIGFISLILLNLVLIFLLFDRKPQNRPEGDQLRNPTEMISTRLDFNDDQKLKLSEFIQRHRDQASTIQKKIEQEKRRLFENLDLDSIQIGVKTSNIGKLHAQLDQLTYDHMNEILSLCNVDQKDRFNRLMHELLRGMRPNGPEGRRPPPRK